MAAAEKTPSSFSRRPVVAYSKPPSTPPPCLYCVTWLGTSCSIFKHLTCERGGECSSTRQSLTHPLPTTHRRKAKKLFSWCLINSNNQWSMKQHGTIPARPYYSQIWRLAEKTNKQKNHAVKQNKRSCVTKLTFYVDSDGPIDFGFRVDLTFVQALQFVRSSPAGRKKNKQIHGKQKKRRIKRQRKIEIFDLMDRRKWNELKKKKKKLGTY